MAKTTSNNLTECAVWLEAVVVCLLFCVDDWKSDSWRESSNMNDLEDILHKW